MQVLGLLTEVKSSRHIHRTVTPSSHSLHILQKAKLASYPRRTCSRSAQSSRTHGPHTPSWLLLARRTCTITLHLRARTIFLTRFPVLKCLLLLRAFATCRPARMTTLTRSRDCAAPERQVMFADASRTRTANASSRSPRRRSCPRATHSWSLSRLLACLLSVKPGN